MKRHRSLNADVLALAGSLGKQPVSILSRKDLTTGDRTIKLDPTVLATPHGNDVYQITVENSNGVFHQCRMMTAAR